MKKRLEGKKDKKKTYRFSAVSILLVFLFAIIGTIGFLRFYDFYIDETLYAERLSQMREVETV